MKSKKYFIIQTFLCFCFTMLNAQVGISTTSPHPSSDLTLGSTDKALLLNRIALTGKNDVTSVNSPQAGMIIYNTATAGTIPDDVVPGFYYFDSGTNKWEKVSSSGGVSENIYTADGSIPSSTSRSVNLNSGSALNIGSNTLVVNGDNANVGIGTNAASSDAILEVNANNKGLLMPRLNLISSSSASPLSSHIAGMTVYNTATASDVTPGYYVNDGTKWVRFDRAESKFFYSPTVSLSVTATGSGFTHNLYSDYLNNLQTPAVSSSGAPSSIPVYAATDLYYYVTDYDTNVFSNISIDASGIMTYDVISATATACSFINVVFVIK